VVPVSRTHIAGLSVTIDDRFMRQRCVWCGYLLLDYDFDRLMVPTGTEDQRPGEWTVGALVRVDGGAKWTVEPVPAGALPADCCTRDPRVGG
jgi:hypothetical protein